MSYQPIDGDGLINLSDDALNAEFKRVATCFADDFPDAGELEPWMLTINPDDDGDPFQVRDETNTFWHRLRLLGQHQAVVLRDDDGDELILDIPDSITAHTLRVPGAPGSVGQLLAIESVTGDVVQLEYVTGSGGGGGGDSFTTIVGDSGTNPLATGADTLNLLGSASIATVGNATADSITFSVVPGGVNHDALLNYSANKHPDITAAVNVSGAWKFKQNTSGAQLIIFENDHVSGTLGISIDGDLLFERGTNDGTLTVASLTAARAWTLPDITGAITVAGNSFQGSGALVRETMPTLAGLISTDDVFIDNEQELRLGTNNAAGDFYVALKSPNGMTASYVLTYPGVSPGGSARLIAYNSSGIGTWIDVPSGGGGGGVANAFTSVQVDSGTAPSASGADELFLLGGVGIETVGVEASDSVTFNVLPGEVDHNALLNYSDDRHPNRIGTVDVTGAWSFTRNSAIDEYLVLNNTAVGGTYGLGLTGKVRFKSGALFGYLEASPLTATRTWKLPNLGGELTCRGNAIEGTAGSAIVLSELPAIDRPSIENYLAILDQGELRLLESGGANYVAIRSGGAMSANYTLYLPTAAPGGTKLIQVDSGGVCTFIDVPSGSSFSTEEAQDAIGTILLDSSTIDFTYDDATPTITAAIKTASVTLAMLADIATARFIGRTTAGTGVPEALTAAQATALLSVFNSSQQGVVPASGGGSANFLCADGTWTPAYTNEAAQDAVGNILGDSGTIDFTYDDTANTITAIVKSTSIDTGQLHDDAVTFAKMQNISEATVLGRLPSAGSGDPAALNATQLAAVLASGSGGGTTNFLRADGNWAAPSGGGGSALNVKEGGSSVDSAVTVLDFQAGFDVAEGTDHELTIALDLSEYTSANIPTGAYADASVTLAKIANIATDRLLGRDTASSGVTEELTVGGGIEFTGSGGIQTSAFTGDVTKSAGGTATTIANDAVTYAKMQNVSATDKVLGRSSSGSGDVEEIACTSAGRALIDDADAAAQRTTLGLAALAVLATVGTSQIDADAVTYAKMQNVSATDKVLGRSSSGSGDVEEIACTAAGRALIDDADAAAQRTTLGLGALAVLATVGTSQIDADAVTYAKMQNVSATDKVLGRSSSGSGDVEEIACTSAGRALIDDADAAAQRTTLGLAAIATGITSMASGSIASWLNDSVPIRDASGAIDATVTLKQLIPHMNAGRCFYIYEDFFNGTTGLGGGLQAVSNGTAASAQAGAALGTNEQGVLQCDTGTTNSGSTIVRTHASSIILGGAAVVFEVKVWIEAASDGTDTYTLRCGLGDSLSGNETDAVGFRYTHGTNSGQWVAYCRSNSVEDTLNSTVPVVANVPDVLRAEINAAANSVEFFINGTSIGTIDNTPSTVIPTGAARATGFAPLSITKTAGTTERAANIDYAICYGEYAAQR